MRYVFLGGLWLLSSQVVAESLVTVYDPQVAIPEVEITSADQDFVMQRVLRTAQEHWVGETDCSADGFTVLNIAEGRFTQRETVEKAYLYQYCSVGHNLANNGIAIFADQQLVAHWLYAGTSDYFLKALPDLNQNGINELLLSSGGTNQGITWEVVSIVEFIAPQVHVWGQLMVMEDVCAAEMPDNYMSVSQRLSVKPMNIPEFYVETSKLNCKKTNSDWSKPSKPRQIKLDKNDVEYVVKYPE